MSLTTADDIRVYIDMGGYAIQGRLIGLTTVAYVVRDETTGCLEVCWRTGVKRIDII
jgi:hypothetical protein